MVAAAGKPWQRGGPLRWAALGGGGAGGVSQVLEDSLDGLSPSDTHVAPQESCPQFRLWFSH